MAEAIKQRFDMNEFISSDDAYDQISTRKSGDEFHQNTFVLKSLVSRDFKLKYRRSILGVLWSLLNPLLMMIVMAAVFSYMFRFKIENFPVYLILGTIMFDYMSRSTASAMTSITESQALIKKVRIEKLIFPLEKVVFELLNFGLSMIAAVAVMAWFRVLPSVHVLWAIPLLVILLTLFCTGLSLLLSALAVFFRDVMHLWSVVITAWTYATPLFYPYDMLDGWMQTVMQFNPMYHYITFFRDVMMWNTLPATEQVIGCVGMALITFLVGYIVFRKTEKKFILYI